MFHAHKTDLRRFVLLSIILIATAVPLPDGSLAAVSVNDERNIEKLAIKRVQPPYPPLARKYNIEGLVIVKVSVARDGKVGKAEFVSGNSLFRSVSLDAAKRWEFKRSDDDSLQGTISFTFRLN